jgi:hypothetical protein
MELDMKKAIWTAHCTAFLLTLLLSASCDQGVVQRPDAVTRPTPGEGNEEPLPALAGIDIVSKPNTTIYARDEAFTGFDGLKVHWLYDNGSRSEDPLAPAEYTLTPNTINTAESGPVPVRLQVLEYPDFTGEFLINVTQSTSRLTGITLTSRPSKTLYNLGEAFSMDGTTVTGNYSDGNRPIANSAVSVEGYERYKRGVQTVTLRVNNFRQTVDVTVKVPAGAAVTLNRYEGKEMSQIKEIKPVYIKGKAFDMAGSNIKARVGAGGGVTALLVYENGGITAADVQGYNPNKTGPQTLTLRLDDTSVQFEVFVINVVPALWFDYGYMRHAGDPTGAGYSAGKYYTKPGETLVLSPVRYLIGYNDDHTDSVTSYNWSVSGGSYDTSAAANGRTFAFKPDAEGDYTVTVQVTGNNETMTASTVVQCYTGTVSTTKTFPDKPGLRNFAPSQFSESGSGFGWSLGSAGGYWVYRVDSQDVYTIAGNPMATWSEAGVVWVQEDKNGNNIPDEMWYELKGGDEYPGHLETYGRQITRNYSLTYVKGTDEPIINGYDQKIRTIYWADCRGRSGQMRGGWSSPWGVSGDWVTFTGTLLRDTGDISTGQYNGLEEMGGYVDCYGWGKWWSNNPRERFYITDAIRADGKPANLNEVRFVKVQTAVFRYGGIFGDISTEIAGADFLGSTTNFPMP